MNEVKPPKLFFRFLEWFCPPSLYEGIEGDLMEQFEHDVQTRGDKRARLNLAWNVLQFFRLDIILRNRLSIQLVNTMMIPNYFKIATRHILKRKLYSFINAFGLSVAIAFCTLIYLFVQDERSFDQFHQNKNTIYRLHATSFNQEKWKKGDKEPYSSRPYMAAKLGDVMLDELAEVKRMTRFSNWEEGVMRYQDKNFNQKYALADSGFFRMFSFKLIAGNPKTIFRNPTDAVLTVETARKYFGDEDPMGKVFTLDIEGPKQMKVAGIIETAPANSSISYEMIVPFEMQPWFKTSREQWDNFSYPTFVQLHEGSNAESFKVHLDALVQKYLGERFKKWADNQNIPTGYPAYTIGFLPLTAIHLRNDISWEKASDPQYSWILGGIAFLILTIACINYISLSLTTSASRKIEVGIRKVVGAQKKQLIQQFGVESIALALISMLIGLGLVVMFLPSFNQFTDKSMEVTLQNGWEIVSVSLSIALLVGFFAGSYPALYLSGFLPALVLKGRFTSRLQTGFTKPLVVFQFFLSASMMICSVIMYKQMHFIMTKDLGYKKDQIINISTQTGSSAEGDRTVDVFRNELKANSAVMGIAGVSATLTSGWSFYGYRVKGESKGAFVYSVDANFIPLLGIQLASGRNFDERIASDSNVLIVNEALVKDMKWTDPLSEHLNWRGDSLGSGWPVIGVVKDYHFLSLEKNIEPMFLSINSKYTGHLTNMMVKISSGDVADKVEQLKKSWVRLFPDRPFEFSFLDEDVAKQYKTYDRWMKIMALSTAFAIIISCLGLFGLSGINAVNRTKEIGIRKVMGAELSAIFILLNRQYVVLACIAFVLAVPLSLYAMNKWLSGFQFAITISWQIFAFSMLAGLAMALLTVSYHALRVALTNPSETLKHD